MIHGVIRRSCAGTVWLFVVAAAFAQPPCTVAPFDGTGENGLGVIPGFVGEYCMELDLSQLPDSQCRTAEGWSWFALGSYGWTRVGNQTEVTYTARLRPDPGAPLTSAPGGAFSVLDDVGHQGIPTFPGSATDDVGFLNDGLKFDPVPRGVDGQWGFGNYSGVNLCAEINGDLNPDVLLITDETAGNPQNTIWATFDNGQLWEIVQQQPGFEDVNSFAGGVTLAPHGAGLRGWQEVPPVDSPWSGSVGIWNTGGDQYRIFANHNVRTPTAAHIHQAPAGQSGGIVVDLGGGPHRSTRPSHSPAIWSTL